MHTCPTLESTTRATSVWVLRRWWHGSGAVQMAIAVSAAALTAVAFAFHASMQTRNTTLLLEEQLHAMHSMSAAASASSVPASTADFTMRLPATSTASSALEIVQGAAGRAAVSVVSEQVQETPHSVERLGRAELAIVVRGSYANLKLWLAEVLQRQPGATVSRLQLQRVDGTTDVEARLSLVLWSQAARVAVERR
jgi:hypothetical protein